MTWDEALSKLHQAPHGEFVAERKRLAVGELKAKLLKVPRPPISAWAVNQLWWHARAAFEDMLGTAKKVKGGSLEAMGEHKAALRKLHERAREILEKEGNAASLSTLARIDTTLAALAAAGGFDPDLPGTLSDDRDPPGFAALGIVHAPVPIPVVAEKKAEAKEEVAEAKEDVEAAREKLKAETEAAKQAEKEATAKAAALQKAQAEVEKHEARVAQLAAELEEARAVLADAKKKVSALG